MDDEDFHAELFKDAPRLHGVPYLSRDRSLSNPFCSCPILRGSIADGRWTTYASLWWMTGMFTDTCTWSSGFSS